MEQRPSEGQTLSLYRRCRITRKGFRKTLFYPFLPLVQLCSRLRESICVLLILPLSGLPT
jgi:hypothetical protein